MRKLFLPLLLIALLLTACSTQQSQVPIANRWASIEGSQLNSPTAGEQFYFTVSIDPTMLQQATPVNIKVSGLVTRGDLRFELRDPQGQPVWNSGTIGPGDFSMTTQYRPTQPGDYRLGLVYSADISATYNLYWHALQLTPGVFLAGTGMLLVALAFLAYSAKQRLSWRYLALGAFFWILTVALKFAWAIPINPLVYKLLGVSDTNLASPGNIIAYIYIGALTGIFEAGFAYLLLRRFPFGRTAWPNALAFGIGFGAFEAILLALASLASATAGYFSPDVIPPFTLASLVEGSNPLFGLAPVVERLVVIFAHIFANVLLFYAVASGQSKWAWLAVLYKTLLDTPAAFAALWGVTTLSKLWAIELIVAVIGLAGLFGSLYIREKYKELDAQKVLSPQADVTPLVESQNP